MTACISRSGYKQRDPRKIQSVLKFWLIVLLHICRTLMMTCQAAALYERASSPIKWNFNCIRLYRVLYFVDLPLRPSLDNDQLDAHLLYFILQYVYYNPLHVSSVICSSSGGWIVFMQHLVSSPQSVAVRCTGRPLTESDDTVCCINTIQTPDDEHIMLETCRGL